MRFVRELGEINRELRIFPIFDGGDRAIGVVSLFH